MQKLQGLQALCRACYNVRRGSLVGRGWGGPATQGRVEHLEKVNQWTMEQVRTKEARIIHREHNWCRWLP